jgi:hypothetical protein
MMKKEGKVFTFIKAKGSEFIMKRLKILGIGNIIHFI